MLPDGISLDDIDLSIGQPPDRSCIESMDWQAYDHLYVAYIANARYHLFKDDKLGKYVITRPRLVGQSMGM